MADSITNMSLVDWLDDLTVRFLLNLPASELSSVPRLCFQVEEAQWFYEDFIRPAAAATGHPLPSLPLRQFCLQLFQHCPLLSGFTDAQHIAAYEEFLAYKVRVPVRGAILMDESMEKLVLVKGWKKGASWSFPRGKINKDEKDLDCAIREVYEETGYDVRRAGLVADNEKDGVKSIDVTMREQHMRLFVFRGVAEDTHFEPQTRKEISKIAWYNVRDLPGFKKQKQGSEQGHHANKFYMVAPFLGPLKKWISQQKRNDGQVAAPSNEPAQTFLETKHDTAAPEEELVTESVDVDKTEELKRLLSIGAPADTIAQQLPAAANGQGKNLLALLQGGPKPAANNVPQKPLEQIQAFPPQEPQTPQPHHPRHPSMGYQQTAPQYQFSPQRVQQYPNQQQRNFSMPAPGPFHPGSAGHFQPNQSQGFPQIPPAHMHQQHFQQQQQHRQSLPTGPISMPMQYPGQQNGTQFNVPQRQPVQPPPAQMPPQMAPQQAMQHHVPRPTDAFMAPKNPQGAGAIASGPAVPKAEALPMPKMNAHSMNLLNAFKSGDKPATTSTGAGTAPRQASQHQTALLGLFKKASEAPPVPTPVAAARAEEPSSPTPIDATERPRVAPKRKPTLNEITRTLPAKLKVKSPPPPLSPAANAQPAQQLPMQAAIPTESQTERLGSRQLYDPAHPKHFVRASSDAAKPEQGALDPQVTIMQRPPPQQQMPRSPKRPGRSPRPKNVAPAKVPAVAAKGAENGTPTPPAFTILARPGSSSRASKSPVPPPQQQQQQVPSGPVRNETPKSMLRPQVLKRPESVDATTVQKAAEVVERQAGSETGDKREQLLALFGRTPAVSSSSPPPVVEAPTPVLARGTTPAATGVEGSKNSLLNLFTNGNQPSTTTTPTLSTQPQPQPQPRAEDTRTHQQPLTFLKSPSPPSTATTPMPPPPSAPHIAPERKPSSQNILPTHRQQTPQNALLDLFTRPSSSSANAALQSPGTPISPFTLGTPARGQAPVSLLSSSSAGPLEQMGGGGRLLPRSRLGSVATVASGGGSDVGGSRKGSGAATPTEASKGFLLDYLNGVVRKEGHRGAQGQRRG